MNDSATEYAASRLRRGLESYVTCSEYMGEAVLVVSAGAGPRRHTFTRSEDSTQHGNSRASVPKIASPLMVVWRCNDYRWNEAEHTAHPYASAISDTKRDTYTVGVVFSVDTEGMMLTVRTADGAVEEFRYNDATEVAGAQDSIAGLAAADAALVTVQFTEEGGARTATRIEVQAGQQ